MHSCVILAIMIVTGACDPDLVPLKGNYRVSALEITSTESTDSIWSHLTHLFTTHGLPVKSIQKKNGVIVSAKTPFISIYSLEDKDGQLQQPQAWVVMPKVVNKQKEWKAKEIYGQWSIQVTETGKGATTIKVDPIIICTYSPNLFTSVEVQGHSTGNLEELIRNSLKIIK